MCSLSLRGQGRGCGESLPRNETLPSRDSQPRYTLRSKTLRSKFRARYARNHVTLEISSYRNPRTPLAGGAKQGSAGETRRGDQGPPAPIRSQGKPDCRVIGRRSRVIDRRSHVIDGRSRLIDGRSKQVPKDEMKINHVRWSRMRLLVNYTDRPEFPTPYTLNPKP